MLAQVSGVQVGFPPSLSVVMTVVVDVTNLAIEETATIILERLKDRDNQGLTLLPPPTA